MVETLLLPFSYGFMTNAMWVSALVGGVCAFLSAYLMLKGWSLIGDALSHSIVPGVALTYMIGLPFVIGAFFSGGLAAGAMLFLKQRTALKEDAVIGLIFSSFFGLRLFLVSLSPTSVDVNTITLGNILAITPDDTLQLLLIAVISLAVLVVKWRDLMVVFFDETHARSIGLNLERMNLLFFHHLVCLLCCSVADGWHLSGDSAGDHAGCNSISTDRSFPASVDTECHNRNGFQLSGCLCQLFSGQCDRWHNHMPADHSVRSCFPACPKAWPFNGMEARQLHAQAYNDDRCSATLHSASCRKPLSLA